MPPVTAAPLSYLNALKSRPAKPPVDARDETTYATSKSTKPDGAANREGSTEWTRHVYKRPLIDFSKQDIGNSREVPRKPSSGSDTNVNPVPPPMDSDDLDFMFPAGSGKMSWADAAEEDDDLCFHDKRVPAYPESESRGSSRSPESKDESTNGRQESSSHPDVPLQANGYASISTISSTASEDDVARDLGSSSDSESGNEVFTSETAAPAQVQESDIQQSPETGSSKQSTEAETTSSSQTPESASKSVRPQLDLDDVSCGITFGSIEISPQDLVSEIRGFEKALESCRTDIIACTPPSVEAPKKKKAKRPKAKTPGGAVRKVAVDDVVPDDEDEAFVASFKEFPVEMTRCEYRGRCMTASRDIEAGDVVYSSTPYAAVVNDNFLESFCHCCYGPISSHQWCSKCNQVWYCSTACKEKHASEHTDRHCEALQKLYATSRDDTSTIRLVMAVLERRRQDVTKGVASIQHSYEDILRLLSHSTDMQPDGISELKSICKLAASLLDETIRPKTDESLLELVCRVKCNHHGLDDLNNRRYGIGIYPRACYFNHSCMPNITYTTEHGVLYIRAISPIPKGDELCLSYTDLYQISTIRRENLKGTYYFDCKCDRCVEPAAASHDRYLKGFKCPIPKCPGILEEVPSGERTVFKCCRCGETKDNVEQLKNTEEIAQAFLQRGLQLRDSGLLFEARSTLEQLLNLYEKIFHPQHSLLFHTYAALMNCCNSILDLGAASGYCRKIINLMETAGCYPKYHPDICAHYSFLGNSYLCLATTACSGADSQEQAMLLDKSVAAFNKCYEGLRICRGAEHAATKEIFAKIRRAEQCRRMLCQ